MFLTIPNLFHITYYNLWLIADLNIFKIINQTKYSRILKNILALFDTFAQKQVICECYMAS